MPKAFRATSVDLLGVVGKRGEVEADVADAIGPRPVEVRGPSNQRLRGVVTACRIREDSVAMVKVQLVDFGQIDVGDDTANRIGARCIATAAFVQLGPPEYPAVDDIRLEADE